VRDYKDLYKEAKGQRTRIYCDMDGVLADFMVAAKKATGMTFTQSDSDKHWAVIRKTQNFWSDMPWMPGGRQLWSYIKKYDTHILSAYSPSDPNCVPGKLKWLRRNVSMSNMNKINLVRRREKKNFAMKSGGVLKQPAILIDDFPRNVDQFKAAGGIGILHTNTAKTIKELKRLGF
jgi:5'(3')-deoxyribonucleotidase|tara:strand:- start:65 stop:592 length:528 start_codon:yes stop_codon:yes gene_type:complete